MATASFLLRKICSTAGNYSRAAAPSCGWWRRTRTVVCSAPCRFSSLSGTAGGGGGLSSSSSSHPLFLSDHPKKAVPPPAQQLEASEFPLPHTSYPVLMIPSISGCRLFNPVTRKFTNFTYNPEERFSGASTYPVFSTKYGWVAYYTYNDGSMLLANPLSHPNPRSTGIFLPPLDTLPKLQSLPIDPHNHKLKTPEGLEGVFTITPETERVFRYHWVEVGRILTLPPYTMREKFSYGQLALSSSPTDEDCVALYLPDHDLRSNLGLDLAFCRVGDTRWSTTTTTEELHPVRHAVYSKRDKVFYALTRCSRMEAFELTNDSPSSPTPTLRRKSLGDLDPSPRLILGKPNKFGKEAYGVSYWIQYLVESQQGDPLLVLRFVSIPAEHYSEEVEGKTLGFQVYKLRFHKEKNKVFLEEYNNQLEDTALFVGRASSFSVPVRDYPGLIPNSVYFYGLREIGIYNLVDRAFTHFFPSFEIRTPDIIRHPMWVNKPQ
ncbi:hypothetical protein Tsubulata_040074 [Turnera subulata]|uniref:KIB1-4 beta-propeller domain-containing protein n=1 Tax=Turnera subulata TaxID=218843 RepID=A0A9Q0GCC6_9ROSI|nr:hypothetical protein Tsubulata_040074 [Turnera subulata]